jgi:regulator of protease activity HflC (stomatin/prohibitin superfamily)
MGIQTILSLVASIAWVAVVGVVAWLVFNMARGQKVGGSIGAIIGGVVLAALLSTAAAGVVFVEAQQRAVVITPFGQGGIRPEPLDSGIHWIVPFVETARFYDVSRRTYTLSSNDVEGQALSTGSIAARTRDGQQVEIDASIIYQPDPARIVDLHRQWQERYLEGVVIPQARSVIRGIASRYGVEEIVSSRRAEMEQAITDELRVRYGEQFLQMDSFVLRNITFSPEYAEAVEQVQVAEQRAQQAEFVVEQRRQEAEQARQVAQGEADAAVIAARGAAEARVIAAEAEADALNRISAVISANPEMLTYQYIQRLAPGVQTIYLPSNQPFLLPLPSGATGAPEATTVPPPPAPTATPTATP